MKEMLDHDQRLYVGATINTLARGRLLRCDNGKLRLPVPQDMRPHPKQLRDIANAEVESLRNLNT
jgi:hypothetical protein